MALFSTTIKVPVSTLQDYASRMQGFADENADVFNRLYNSLQCLEGGEWQGESLKAAMAATRQNRERFSETISELNQLANFMKKFADEMAAKDEEIKKNITSV